MANLPSVKWLGLGAASSSKSSAIKHGEQQKRAADVAYSQTLPTLKPSGAQLEQQWLNSQIYPVGASTAVSAPIGNMPSQAELAVLQDLGWETPGVETPKQKKSADTFNYQDKHIQQSEAFDYGLDEQQIKNLEDLYRDTPGFKAPDQNAASSIRVMAEKNELAPVTWKQWDKMTPDQRKAATWNSQLWKATQRDIRLAEKRSTQDWSPDRQQKYDDLQTKIFGETGGSEIRAINTLKFLEKIDFTAVGHDLDEYLSGDRLITAKEMENFKVGGDEPTVGVVKTTTERKTLPFSIGPVTPASKPGPRDSDLVTTTVDNYADIKSGENLVKLESAAVKALDDEIRERMSAADTFGWNIPSVLSDKKFTPEDIPLGYSNPGYRGLDPESYKAQKEDWFNTMWVNLNDPDQDLKDTLKDISISMQKGQFDPELQQEVWDWIDKRTSWHGEYGQPDDLGFSLRDPHEIRAALGWEK